MIEMFRLLLLDTSKNVLTCRRDIFLDLCINNIILNRDSIFIKLWHADRDGPRLAFRQRRPPLAYRQRRQPTGIPTATATDWHTDSNGHHLAFQQQRPPSSIPTATTADWHTDNEFSTQFRRAVCGWLENRNHQGSIQGRQTTFIAWQSGQSKTKHNTTVVCIRGSFRAGTRKYIFLLSITIYICFGRHVTIYMAWIYIKLCDNLINLSCLPCD